VERFLGGYSALAAESAVAYVLAEENSPQFRRARSKIARKLLDKPICELVSGHEKHDRKDTGSEAGGRETDPSPCHPSVPVFVL
jgi:hypothetical protein